MANSGSEDNASQFFITLDKTEELNKKHTLFGKITGNTIFNILQAAEVWKMSLCAPYLITISAAGQRQVPPRGPTQDPVRRNSQQSV